MRFYTGWVNRDRGGRGRGPIAFIAACTSRISSTLLDLGAKLKWLVVEHKPQSNGGGHDD